MPDKLYDKMMVIRVSAASRHCQVPLQLYRKVCSQSVSFSKKNLLWKFPLGVEPDKKTVNFRVDLINFIKGSLSDLNQSISFDSVRRSKSF
jgi:hypothetical protein